MMRKKIPKIISSGTPMMSHDSNGAMFPWHGHASFEISVRQHNPILAEILKLRLFTDCVKKFPNKYPMELL